MVKYTQTICRLLPTNYLSMFDHFVVLVLQGLKTHFLSMVVDFGLKVNQTPMKFQNKKQHQIEECNEKRFD